ncbi:MAG: aminotransferase class I/II-fold pyridoxal phosphate-dependent enzyme [Opitutaceae bacterium]|nr:aminotransferase class I/II-fold pyridoxal phosphate-dependent enzyme [Opitutaceae bacterium]
MHEAVAIIGVGARFPGAADASAFLRMIAAGRVHTQPVPAQRWDHAVVHSPSRREPNKTPARLGAFIERFDRFAPEAFGITPKRARIMDPQQRLMLEVSRQALEDAGYAQRRLADGRAGVYVGACSSDHRTLVAGAVNIPCDAAGRSGAAPALTPAELAALTAALPPIQGYSIVGQQLNMIAANVSQAFDFNGPAFALDTACSSALAALHEAVLHLRSGVVDAALVGGVYVQLDPIMMVCFSRIGALSFTDRCLPFQREADGFVMGEGVGVTVLKRLADAQRDGDRILAVIRGIAMNNDGRGAGPLTPLATGQAAAIAAAWQAAGVDPGSVGLLEAHATGTAAGDRIELEALARVFGPHVRGRVPISSIKANIGHGLASAGMASLLKAVFAVHAGRVWPQPLAGELRPEFAGEAAWLRVPTQAEPWPDGGATPRRAGVSAFGFGGTNVHVVLEAPPQAAPRPAAARRPVWRCALSAPDAARLAGHCREVAAALREAPVAVDLADVATTLAARPAGAVQVAVLASTGDELGRQLDDLAARLDGGEVPPLPAGGETAGGGLVVLPPTPLAERRFWLIDETKTRRASGSAPPPVAAPADAPASGGSLDLVVAAIAEVTARRPGEIRPEHAFVADLGFDSLTTLEFMTVLGRSLPGYTPPRTLFTTALTVRILAEHLDQARVVPGATTPRPALTVGFDRFTHAWLDQHRPGGRAILPLSALVTVALAERTQPVALTDFRVLGPVAIGAGRVELARSDDADGEFTLALLDGAPVARGQAAAGADGWEPLGDFAVTPGRLTLDDFYARHAFHGPALRALAGVPQVGPDGITGALSAATDPVVTIDGILQLALYWLAAHRGQAAVATGFAAFRQHAPWPTAGVLNVRGRLADADGTRYRADFDVCDEAGRLVLQWRGIEAQALGEPAGEAGAGPAAWPEVRDLARRKAALAAAGFAMPYFQVHDGVAAATTRIGGREFLNFASYNYLGLAGDPAVSAAAAEAVQRYGTSASASRVASGERPLHAELERALAAFLGCDDALTLVGGHATNVTVIGHLFGPEDLVIHDSLAHDCIVSGARLSGARRLAFPHNDLDALEALLRRERARARRVLIAVEGVYSMDGDLAPLDAIVALKRRHQAMLLVDEAHSLGVLGPTGRGAGEHFGTDRRAVDLWMGTMSKALASAGGYLAGEAALIDYLRYTLPGFVYSVGLPPANAAAALAALRLLEARPELPRRLQARSDLFRDLCRARGLDSGLSRDAAIVPCITGTSELALRAAQDLGGRGINVQPIFYPAVEEGKARLRFFITAAHTETQLRDAAEALAEVVAARPSPPA